MESTKRTILCDTIHGGSERDASADYATALRVFAREFWNNAGLVSIEKKDYFRLFAAFIARLILHSGYEESYEEYCVALAEEYNKNIKYIKTVFRNIQNFILKTDNKDLIYNVDLALGNNTARYFYKDLELMESISGHIRRRLRENGYTDHNNPIYKSVLLAGPRCYALPEHIEYERLVATIDYELQCAIRDGYENFYIGMYDDISVLFAGCVLRFKEQFPQIRFIAVLPYENCEADYNIKDRLLFPLVVNSADEKIVISDDNTIQTFYCYVYYMATHCERAIIISDGKYGGSPAYAYNYAFANGLDIRFISPYVLLRS